ncbi:NfeD family protein [Snodgrassella sp. CFCC 13594]|uniref:NfeD family protein n=1 Tax=Snodgrassella sp. CFCC 13594 TaxID=1775559 RepID=UPI0035109DDA
MAIGYFIGRQCLIASLFSIMGIILVRRWQKRHRQHFGHNVADDPDHQQLVVVESSLPGNLWLVRYRGTQWQARFQEPDYPAHIGDSARIDGKEGNILLISALLFLNPTLNPY